MVSKKYRTRKLLQSRFYRLLKWEFWPIWAVYFPVSFYIVWLALKYRHATVFTAANPAIPMGGIMGVNKSKILTLFQQKSPENIPDFVVLSEKMSVQEKTKTAKAFIQSYPIVVKPDNGQRGESVVIVQNEHMLEEAIKQTPYDTIIQNYVSGDEFGVFVIKDPDTSTKIFSITHKLRPTVTGDGVRSLEQLILDDKRANLMAKFFLKKHNKSLSLVPKKGEKFPIVDLGTHCQGAVFKDANHLKTKQLENALDEILNKAPGLYFGRFDIRVPSINDFKKGKNLSILEMNGVTSEPTHIYDPEASIFVAWRVLCQQWHYAFKIGKKNLSNGTKTATVRAIIKQHRTHKRMLFNLKKHIKAG